MSGFVDLHCHYIPGVDDGVRTPEDGIALCRGLAALGYSRVVATPHIRTAMFENRKAGLETSYTRFREAMAGDDAAPQLGLAAEHYFDDVFWELFMAGEALPYPGGRAALVEFPSDSFPIRVADRMFQMNVKGVRPVLAHPERYPSLFRTSDPLDPLLDVGVIPQLDLMSLVGRYGRRPKNAAERMLEEGLYGLACSDSHRPGDLDDVARALDRLRSLLGEEEARELLSDGPGDLLEGNA